jgi:hypothetical protein
VGEVLEVWGVDSLQDLFDASSLQYSTQVGKSACEVRTREACYCSIERIVRLSVADTGLVGLLRENRYSVMSQLVCEVELGSGEAVAVGVAEGP